MKKLALLTLAFALLGCSSGGTLTINDGNDLDGVAFYGYVTEGGVPLVGTKVVWTCEDTEAQATCFTNDDGYYEVRGDSVEGYHVIGEAYNEYEEVVKTVVFESCPPLPVRCDFEA